MQTIIEIIKTFPHFRKRWDKKKALYMSEGICLALLKEDLGANSMAQNIRKAMPMSLFDDGRDFDLLREARIMQEAFLALAQDVFNMRQQGKSEEELLECLKDPQTLQGWKDKVEAKYALETFRQLA